MKDDWISLLRSLAKNDRIAAQLAIARAEALEHIARELEADCAVSNVIKLIDRMKIHETAPGRPD